MNNQFERLVVWKRSHAYALAIYTITATFPAIEKFGLIDQLRRSVSSVATNIVEGNERRTKNEFIHFLYIAKGSLAETKYHLLLAKDLGYLRLEDYHSLTIEGNELGKMINGLIHYLTSSI